MTIASQSFDFDGEGRLARQGWTVDGSTSTAATGYAPGGEVIWRAYPDGDSVGSASTPWTYDLAGRLYSVPNTVTSTTYEADGPTRQIAYPNTIATSFAYELQRGWVSGISTSSPTISQTLTYTRAASPGSCRAFPRRAGTTATTVSTG